MIRNIVQTPILRLPLGRGAATPPSIRAAGHGGAASASRWVLARLLAPLVLIVGGCRDEIPTPVASPPLLESGADQVMTGLEHVMTVNGVREGVVRADTAFFFQDSTVTHLRNPILELFETETGVAKARVTAERGRYNMTTKELTAFGNVVLEVMGGNQKVETAELHYEPDQNRISSDSMTVMTDASAVSTGLGFTTDLEFRNMRVGAGSIRRTGGGGVLF